MNYLSFDTETDLIKPGMHAPEMVCTTWAEKLLDLSIDTYCDDARQHTDARKYLPPSGILLRDGGIRLVRRALENPRQTLIGHNTAYDLGVCVAEDPSLLPLVFKGYNEGRVRDTLIREQLISIACGEMKFYEDDETGRDVKSEFSLAAVVRKRHGRWVEKTGDDPASPGYWRLRYRELRGVPLAEWPEPARRYAVGDALDTDSVFWEQYRFCKREGLSDEKDDTCIPDEVQQTKVSWALHLLSMWGVRTDGVAVERLKLSLEQLYGELQEGLIKTGLIRPAQRGKKDPTRILKEPSKNMAAIRARIQTAWEEASVEAQISGSSPPPLLMTEGSKNPDGTVKSAPQISTERKVLVESQDPGLLLLADLMKVEKILGTYVPPLERGAVAPLSARYNTLVETGRVSAASPNLTNVPREGNIRYCFVARPGTVFCSCDYDTAELRSWAQVCYEMFGESALRDELNAGEDPHLSLGARLAGMTKELAKVLFDQNDKGISEFRQKAKIPNFGLPGGMGVRGLIGFAEGYGVKMTRKEAEAMIQAWNLARPEAKRYFAVIANMLGPDGTGTVKQFRSGRIRGGVNYTSAANGFFQGLTADGAKAALWNVCCECYLGVKPDGTPSPLFGCRPVIFVHDELILEMPEAQAAEASVRLSVVMIESMKYYTPDVVCKATPVIMRRWYKGAKSVSGNPGVPVKPNPSIEPPKGTPERKVWKAWVADNGLS